MNFFDTTILIKAGVKQDGVLAKAARTRENIFELTQAAEAAVLRPHDSGAFGHELRAAMAARVARLSADEALSAHYLADAKGHANLADPAETGADQGLETVLAFVDKVANQTKNVSADDIIGLQDAGLADADVVRLCELVAFLAYQIRVTAGLRLMQEAAT